MTGSILGGAFRLLRQHPLSVLVWAILYLIGIFSIGLLRVAMVPAGPQTMAGLLTAGVLSQGLTLALVAVLITAATRATLHPYKRGACYLRLGGNELRVFALLAMLAIASAVLLFLLALVNGFLVSLLGWLLPGSATVEWVGPVLGLAEFAAFLFVQVRLSIALPLTYLYEAITVDEAWVQSRGHFWSIFAAFLAIALLLLLGWSVLIGAFFAPVLGDLFATGLRAETLAQALVRVTLAGRALPVFGQLTLIVGSLVLMALGFVLSTATLASAARAMLGLKEGQIEDLRRAR